MHRPDWPPVLLRLDVALPRLPVHLVMLGVLAGVGHLSPLPHLQSPSFEPLLPLFVVVWLPQVGLYLLLAAPTRLLPYGLVVALVWAPLRPRLQTGVLVARTGVLALFAPPNALASPLLRPRVARDLLLHEPVAPFGVPVLALARLLALPAVFLIAGRLRSWIASLIMQDWPRRRNLARLPAPTPSVLMMTCPGDDVPPSFRVPQQVGGRAL